MDKYRGISQMITYHRTNLEGYEDLFKREDEMSMVVEAV